MKIVDLTKCSYKYLSVVRGCIFPVSTEAAIGGVLYQKGVLHSCFPVKSANFLSTPILRSIYNGYFCEYP